MAKTNDPSDAQAKARIHHPGKHINDPDLALELLKEGNERFCKGMLTKKHSHADDREILSTGQKPFAVVLTCSDSRVAPEIFFDLKLGNIFTIRNAGNIADPTAMGSLEYAVEHLQTKLVVVVGHSKCGAVTAACSEGELPPNIEHIIKYIKPAVKEGGSVNEAIHENVKLMVERIRKNATVKHLEITVAGAYYDIHSGKVSWL